MNNRRKGPASAIYAMSLFWLRWAFIFPLYSVFQYIPLGFGAWLVYNVVKGADAKKEIKSQAAAEEMIRKAEKEARETLRSNLKKVNNTSTVHSVNNTSTATSIQKAAQVDPAIAHLVKQRDTAVSEMKRLNDDIPDEKISAQIEDLQATTEKILDQVIAHPEQENQISKFLDYYLPTTLKLLNTYDRMSQQGISGENIDTTIAKVNTTLDMVVLAFHKQLDTLFAGEALDVSTDISVMENLMKAEGLSGDDIVNMQSQQQM